MKGEAMPQRHNRNRVAKKHRGGDGLEGMVWIMPSQEVCARVPQQIQQANVAGIAYKNLEGVFYYVQRQNVHYLVYLLIHHEDELGFQLAQCVTELKAAGGVLCEDGTLIRSLLQTCWKTYREKYLRK